jgi:hypothetical protein
METKLRVGLPTGRNVHFELKIVVAYSMPRTSCLQDGCIHMERPPLMKIDDEAAAFSRDQVVNDIMVIIMNADPWRK